eukprot:2678999-Pyramimonas_sp.AAC.1
MMHLLDDAGYNLFCPSIAFIANTSVFRTAMGSSAWDEYLETLAGIRRSSNYLIPARLVSGWFAEPFLS